MKSIKDVARIAGVSVTTVSHVINKTRFVAPATKAKVEQAISQIGYQPNSLARALKSKSSQTLGMLVSTSANPFFADVIRGVEEGCYQQEYSLILCNCGDQPDRPISYLKTLMQKRIDGLLVMTSIRDEEFVKRLANLSLPKVLLDNELGLVGCAIGDDSIRGGELVANYLVKTGHRSIGCLTGPMDHPRMRDRHRGFAQTLGTAGVSLKKERCIADELSSSGGYRAMNKLLEQEGQLDAVFCFNDLMAIGAYRALSECSLSIPDDVAVIGYDDLELSTFLTPSLTTIRQSGYDLGLAAANILIKHLDQKTEMPSTIRLEPELVVRESVRS